MQIGFLTVHPITVPFGNELACSIANTIHYGTLVYTGVIQPELDQFRAILNLI